jgi:nicotinamide-nucleotide amidase
VLRFHGVGESTVAQALDAAGGEPPGVEATICARDGEIHVDLLADPGAEAAAAALEAAMLEPIAGHLFARDERPIAQIVLERCEEAGLTVATAESCTGGLVAAYLTAVPGASAAFLGSVVAYADAVKRAELGVAAETLAAHGAVSPETAAEMARGARERLGADAAVAITGIAGPDGGTPEKPVGLVDLHAVGPAGEHAAELRIAGDRDTVRGRAAVAALHLLHRAVGGPG